MNFIKNFLNQQKTFGAHKKFIKPFIEFIISREYSTTNRNGKLQSAVLGNSLFGDCESH